MLNMDVPSDGRSENETTYEAEATAAKVASVSAKEKPSVLETLNVNAEKSQRMFGKKANHAEQPTKGCI